MKNVILASASPRRRELLEQIGIQFVVQPARGEEQITSTKPDQVVKELSFQKAMEVTERNSSENEIVIGADTIVSCDGKILGKPENVQDARRMLEYLSGRTHEVYTGVTAICMDQGKRKVTTFYEKTEVTFYPLTVQEIEDYIQTGEPMDKAGAYGIQGIGSKFIACIHGDYNNVVGLPIARLYQEVLGNWLL